MTVNDTSKILNSDFTVKLVITYLGILTEALNNSYQKVCVLLIHVTCFTYDM